MPDDGAPESALAPAEDALRSSSFGTVAEVYDRYRPTFPPEALAWALGDPALEVLDLGAGTGLMTQVLVDLGHQVVAVEPDDAMRHQIPGRAPDAICHAGSAEAIPLPDASEDAVVAAESYHWFDKPRALPEIARVLRPQGRLVIVWNVSDESVTWVKDFHALLQSVNPAPRGGTGRAVSPEPWFTVSEDRRFPHAHTTDADGLVGMAATWSPIIVSPRRDEVLDSIRTFATTHPDLAGRSSFDVPYLTRVVVCRVADHAPA